MRPIVLMAYATLAGCATSGATPATSGSGTTSGMETVRVAGAGGGMVTEIHTNNDGMAVSVPGSMERAWAAVRYAYDSLSLPVATFDPATRTIASPTLRVRRRLGETNLSRYVNCGNVNGGNADSYEVQLMVQTKLKAVDAGTTSVLTTVFAEGRPITLSGEYSRCTTTSALERRLVDLVNAQLTR